MDNNAIELSRSELLVLFEFCHRICETGVVAASHASEVVVIDKIAGYLESTLEEPFQENYPDMLQEARRLLIENYRRRMGEAGWVEEISLEQN